ncbi:ATP binding [Rhizoctonia solani]|uniref:ATP binding n=1 Tax=Rhizoctonia solani TaxID=456999 RepID=A0A8H7IEQ6_9AGAM|nr:ATP binding [Rhizoctonia solani]
MAANSYSKGIVAWKVGKAWNVGSESTNNVGAKPSENVWEKESQIMIGIDIGSTQSGVAFTFLQKGAKQIIERVNSWPGQKDSQSKIPTQVWYDKHGKRDLCKACVIRAETTTEEAREKADEHKWILAKRFKLHLHPKELRDKFSIKVDPLPDGVTLPQIYSEFLEYLFKHTEPCFKKRIVDGSTIWQVQKGFNFAVCDAGGSTVDTAVYRVTAVEPFLKLAEKREAACVQAGGLAVDDAIEEYLQETLTRVGLDARSVQECVRTGVDDFEEFPKRQFLEDSDSLKLKLGTGVGDTQCCSGKPIIRSVDDQITGANVSHILLVGGFGDSPHLQQQLKDRYERLGSELSNPKAVAEGSVAWNIMTSLTRIRANIVNGARSTTSDGYEKVNGVWCEIVKKGVPLDADHVCRQSFVRTYSTPNPNLESIEIALYSYSGSDQPKWLRSKGGSLLKGFENVCLITADLRGLSGALEARVGPQGQYWGLLFWVCVRFGDTEISAYLEWEEDARLASGRSPSFHRMSRV